MGSGAATTPSNLLCFFLVLSFGGVSGSAGALGCAVWSAVLDDSVITGELVPDDGAAVSGF